MLKFRSLRILHKGDSDERKIESIWDTYRNHASIHRCLILSPAVVSEGITSAELEPFTPIRLHIKRETSGVSKQWGTIPLK